MKRVHVLRALVAPSASVAVAIFSASHAPAASLDVFGASGQLTATRDEPGEPLLSPEPIGRCLDVRAALQLDDTGVASGGWSGGDRLCRDPFTTAPAEVQEAPQLPGGSISD